MDWPIGSEHVSTRKTEMSGSCSPVGHSESEELELRNGDKYQRVDKKLDRTCVTKCINGIICIYLYSMCEVCFFLPWESGALALIGDPVPVFSSILLMLSFKCCCGVEGRFERLQIHNASHA